LRLWVLLLDATDRAISLIGRLSIGVCGLCRASGADAGWAACVGIALAYE